MLYVSFKKDLNFGGAQGLLLDLQDANAEMELRVLRSLGAFLRRGGRRQDKVVSM
jgi:hypothetical protein